MTRAETFTRTFHKVKDHMGWDDKKTSLWFLTPNPHFGGLSPQGFLNFRPDKFERVLDGMISENTAPEEKG